MDLRLLHCGGSRLFADALDDVMRSRGHVVTWLQDPGELDVAAGPFDTCLVEAPAGGCALLPDLIRRARAVGVERVVVLLTRHDPALSAFALQAGADAVVPMTAPIELTLQTIEGVREGNVGWTTGPESQTVPATQADAVAFTVREHEVLSELASGHSTERIADNLGVAHSTARTYIQNIMTKLGVHSKVQAVAVAFTLELVQPTNLTREPAGVARAVPAGGE